MTKTVGAIEADRTTSAAASVARISHTENLQSARGIAAMAVLVHHSLRSLGDGSPAFFVSEHLINAHAAVVFFFVLSGYVLTASFDKRGLTLSTTASFYVRRAFRLLPALWCALGLSILYVAVFRNLPSPDLSAWMAGYFAPSDLTPFKTLQAFLGLDSHLLPTAWTIIVEVIASIALPAILFVMGRGRWAALALLVGLLIVSFTLGVSARRVPLYLVQFMIGAMAFYAGQRVTFRINSLIGIIAVIVLLFFRLAYPWDYHAPLPSLVEGLAAVVVVLAIAQGRFAWLNTGALMRLGDWSYSLYLVHLPVLLILIKILDGLFDLVAARDGWSVVIAVLTATVSLVLGAILYSRVELPAIRIGKGLGDRAGDVLRRGRQGQPSETP